MLAVRQMEPDRGRRLPGPRNADAQLRDALAVRHLALLRRRVRLLSETLQG